MKPAELNTKNMFLTTFNLEPHLLAVARRFFVFGADFNECERVLSSLQSTDEWFPKWSAKATHFEEMATEAFKRSKLITAREAYYQAFFFHRLASFPLIEDTPARRESYQNFVAAFRRAVELDNNLHLDFIEVPIAEQSFPGYLNLPLRIQGKVPTVIFIPGADGWKEDQLSVSVRPLAERGVACIIVDGPGQGEALGRRGIHARHDYEVVVSAILDYLERRPEIDMTRVGLVGSSMGGYYAPRAAAFEKRIKAFICFSALFDVVEGLFDVYPPIRPRMMECIGAKTIEETRQRCLPFTLKEVAHQIESPGLILHGGKDIICPPSEAYRLYDALKSPREIKVWEDGSHNLGNHMIEARALMWDWLTDKLG